MASARWLQEVHWVERDRLLRYSQALCQVFGPPMSGIEYIVTHCQPSTSRGVGGIQFDRSAQQWCGRFRIETLQLLPALEEVIIGSPELRRFALRLLGATRCKPANETGHNRRNNLVLDGKYGFKIPIVALSPEMLPGGHFD